MPGGRRVRLLGRWRRDFDPDERVSVRGRGATFYGYSYDHSWTRALVTFDGETEETEVRLRDVEPEVTHAGR